ncbi:MAG: hypothetical protein ACI9GH_000017 [Candidatus Paceibacteria bacterium]|jgi:hypothetical protein
MNKTLYIGGLQETADDDLFIFLSNSYKEKGGLIEGIFPFDKKDVSEEDFNIKNLEQYDLVISHSLGAHCIDSSVKRSIFLEPSRHPEFLSDKLNSLPDLSEKVKDIKNILIVGARNGGYKISEELNTKVGGELVILENCDHNFSGECADRLWSVITES